MKISKVIILLVAVVFISGCYDNASVDITKTTSTSGIVATGELKEFTVEGSEFKYNPGSITVNKGDKVKINFKNTGSTSHNFVIKELGVSTKLIRAGSTDLVEFIADKSGTFTFYCSVPGHRSKGMEGKININ